MFLSGRYGDVRDANEMRMGMIANRLLPDWTSTRQRKENKRKGNDMKAVLIIPIESLRGKLREDGYYFRVYRGEQIVQKCPRKWEDTPARKAARERFVEKYGKKKARN